MIEEVIRKAKKFHYQVREERSRILRSKFEEPMMGKWERLADQITEQLNMRVDRQVPVWYPCQWLDITIESEKLDNENSYSKHIHLYKSQIEPYATIVGSFHFRDSGIDHNQVLVLDEIGVYGKVMKEVKRIALEHYDLEFLDPRELLTVYNPIPEVPITYIHGFGPNNLFEYLFADLQIYKYQVLKEC